MTNEIVTIEKLYQDRLWIIHIHEFSRAAVDAWEAAVREYIAMYNNAPERYLIYDVANLSNMAFTVYLRERAIVLAQDNREACGRVAIVTRAPNTIVYIFDIFIRFTGKLLQPALDVKLFGSYEEALGWVSAILPITKNNG